MHENIELNDNEIVLSPTEQFLHIEPPEHIKELANDLDQPFYPKPDSIKIIPTGKGPWEPKKHRRRAASPYANLHYIRAAIFQATGIQLTISKTAQYLVEEGMLTPKAAKSLIFDNYDSLYVTVKEDKDKEDKVVPLDREIIR